ncbi:MACPF domain-containing protein [Aestuariirhabdus sp. Z084]|uniref:MAC/perforin domain-containing protein n=1 Tax=Aestuariirhabdus haliotis TaxID=2918751 RepID=UPI00201B4292|nr:MAC/perforin domain-containing protein [Aestuariirhabdus haliotis]MCL6415717.1 MACPF domain-containing protein [Aestuariirhabdus haliotis]MCL6419757.1 MACPF domain-containing protein [Aestuariirhabdus haliotis]
MLSINSNRARLSFHFVALISLLLTGCTSLSPSTTGNLGASQSTVGSAIYLPETDLGRPIAAGQGRQVFANLDDDNCVVFDPKSKESSSKVHTWTKTEAYFGYLNSDTKVGVSLTNVAVLSTSLSAASQRSVDRTTTIAGSVYEFNAYKQLFTLSSECITARTGKGQLDQTLLEAFNALPYPVSDPSRTRAWEPYQRFLEIYGSHYVDQVRAGARYRNYTFKKPYKSVNESELAIAACISAQKLPTEAGMLSLNGCEGINQKQIESVKLTDYTSNPTAFGGDETLRSQLAGGAAITPELLAKFSDTADTEQDGVQYSLTPIWKLFLNRAGSNQSMKNRARTLEAYFEGFVASNCQQQYGCGCSLVKDKKENVTLRRFIQTDKAYASYRCEQPVVGCRRDEDCHYSYGVTTGNYCQCYGDHCVNRGTGGSSVVNYSTKISGKNKGPNRSCYYKVGGCKCKHPAKGQGWDSIWSNE